MSVIVVPHKGKILDADMVKAVDALLNKVRSRPMWEVIDFIVSIFLKKYPEYAKKTTDNLINPFAATKNKEFRNLLNLPPDLKETVEYFYAEDIKAIGEIKFWRAFAKRYPNFSKAEKI